MASPTKIGLLLLASEWGSKRGGLSTFNRELAIQLAKHSDVQVSVFVPQCDQDETTAALNSNVTLVQATRMPGYDEIDWLCSPPDDLQIDFVIGHGAVLGRQAQLIRKHRQCKWVQFVHTDPEELGMFKDYPDPISRAEKKHRDEVDLCVMADCVVAVGPKLADAYSHYLRYSKKDQNLLVFTPGIFSEFDNAVQSKREGGKCRVLAFGRGDAEDFALKGFDIAAEAVGKLKDAHLIFVGATDKKQEEVASRLKKCNLPPNRLRVRTYIETRERLKNQFSEVDLAIMPSRTEGFGLVALEAMSACLPILVSNNSGFGEVLKKVPHGSQCVIDSDDAEVWAKNIEKVWNKDREVRLVEAEDLRNSYGKKYSWKEQCSVLFKKIKSMLNGRTFSSLTGYV